MNAKPRGGTEMKTATYIEGILLFVAITLLLVPIQELSSAQEIPVSLVVALGSYGLLLIARRPRQYANEKLSTPSRRTAWYLAMTGVLFGVIMSYAATIDQSGFMAAISIYLVALFYGLALSMLVFSFIGQRPVSKSEHNHLPRHRFNTLELSI